MAFIKKEWKDRLVEFAGRRTLTDVSTGASQIVDVARTEGQISQAGDAISAENLNDLEQRIGDAFLVTDGNVAKLNSDLDSFEAIKYQDFETASKVIDPHAFVSFSFVASPPDGYSLLGFINLCVNYPLGVAGDISITGNTLSGYMGNASNIRYDRALVRGRAVFIKNINQQQN